MEGEFNNFVMVWVLAFVSFSYCYTMAKIIPSGRARLLTIIPVMALFLFLPLRLNTLHLGGTFAFFIAWLANFKLLLFAFGEGPLASDPSISLLRFAALASLPIKIQQNPPPNGPYRENPSLEKPKKGQKSPVVYTVKGVVLAMVIVAAHFSEDMHPIVSLFLLLFQMYLSLEFILALVATLPRVLLGMELAPQFNEPYLSTSLQDFWGRRWNIMASSILRPTVYLPTLHVSARLFGRKWAPIPAVMATFIVSAVMHELIFYYMGRTAPTWHISFFFVLHGLCLTVELALKKVLGGILALPAFVSGPLTVAFVVSTGFWLFFPQLLRLKADVRAIEEYAAFVAFLKDIGRALTFNLIRGYQSATYESFVHDYP